MEQKRFIAAIVAACTGVVGRSLVQQLTEQGIQVVGFCRPGSEQKVADLESDSFCVFSGDMSDSASCQSLVTAACERLGGKIDAHFHAVGTYQWKYWADITAKEVEDLWTSNFTTAWTLGREVFRRMQQQGGGSLTFVSNRDTITLAPAGFGPYLAPKAALNMFVQSLAAEGKDKNIRVNAVLPTIIDTEVNRRNLPDQDPSLWVNPNRLARTMIDLANPENSDITGALLPVHARLL